MRSHRFPAAAFLALLSVAVIVSVAACGRSESATERMTERLLERASGGKAKVDLKGGGVKIKTAEGETELGSAAEWPSDLPPSLPKFEAGKLQNVMKNSSESGKSWFITIAEVPAKDVRGYIEALKVKGWAPAASSQDDGETILFTATRGDASVTLTYSSSGEKTVGLSVFVKAAAGN